MGKGIHPTSKLNEHTSENQELSVQYFGKVLNRSCLIYIGIIGRIISAIGKRGVAAQPSDEIFKLIRGCVNAFKIIASVKRPNLRIKSFERHTHHIFPFVHPSIIT